MGNRGKGNLGFFGRVIFGVRSLAALFFGCHHDGSVPSFFFFQSDIGICLSFFLSRVFSIKYQKLGNLVGKLCWERQKNEKETCGSFPFFFLIFSMMNLMICSLVKSFDCVCSWLYSNVECLRDACYKLSNVDTC
ncbi:hypothetical protein QBC36DRAFT_1804 [Triangularia setosa]|uniref:Transmembrane protein n=1 Tax=Triangularia setosa TaxID=2587417 RepID=A0AAN6WIA9_9PEZI|nr:hypothetical protein QBC36DRAFT_1804 [Podospora setosa]